MAVATADAIVDRVIALVTALVPATDAASKFRVYRESDTDFETFASGNADGALRRFQAMDAGLEDPPEATNIDMDMRHFIVNVRVAYPVNGRYGGGANGRTKVIDQDWGLINGKIGIYGRANFSGAYDCTPLGATKTVTRGNGVDILEIEARFSYYRAVTT